MGFFILVYFMLLLMFMWIAFNIFEDKDFDSEMKIILTQILFWPIFLPLYLVKIFIEALIDFGRKANK